MPCSAYTCLDVCKNHLLIFSSFLDIWDNVEWPRFLDHPVYNALVSRTSQRCNCKVLRS